VPRRILSEVRMGGTRKMGIGESTLTASLAARETNDVCLNSFFYADERNADGSIKGMQIDGDAHAEFYAQLASGEGWDVPWHATFVKGEGYKNF
jgi:hypothetical protein